MSEKEEMTRRKRRRRRGGGGGGGVNIKESKARQTKGKEEKEQGK